MCKKTCIGLVLITLCIYLGLNIGWNLEFLYSYNTCTWMHTYNNALVCMCYTFYLHVHGTKLSVINIFVYVINNWDSWFKINMSCLRVRDQCEILRVRNQQEWIAEVRDRHEILKSLRSTRDV